MRRTPHAIVLTLSSLLLGSGLLTVTQPGCGLVPAATSWVDKIKASIDNAVRDLGQLGADLQMTQKELVNQILQEGRSDLANEVQSLFNRTIAAAAAEGRCSADLLRRQLIEDLQALRDGLSPDGGVPQRPRRTPTLCTVDPAGVDVSLVNSGRVQTLIFWGANFDDVPLKIFHVEGGRELDVTPLLARTTHYQLVVPFGLNGVRLSARSERLILRADGKELSRVPVIQPPPPVCRRNNVSYPVNSIWFMPPHVPPGNRDFGGNGPAVTASVTLAVVGPEIRATIYMDAIETGGDLTHASGSGTYTIYTAPAGWRIRQLAGMKRSDFFYVDTDTVDDLFAGSGPVRQWVFKGDNKGEDAGVQTGVTVEFANVQVELEETGGGCVSSLVDQEAAAQ